jgi:hypothetical protein
MRQAPSTPSHNHPFQITRIRQVSADAAVAELDIGPVHVGSVWIGGIAANDPFVNWPKSAKGFPVVTIADDGLRQDIESTIIERVKSSPIGEVRA